jgi:hypothetical protein
MQTWTEQVIDHYLEHGPIPPGDYSTRFESNSPSTVELVVLLAEEEIARITISSVEYIQRTNVFHAFFERIGLLKKRFVEISAVEAGELFGALATSIFQSYRSDLNEDLPMMIH